jgi:uncharacterized protein
MPTLSQAHAWYPNDPVHGFDHVLRVVRLAEQLALAEGADLEIVRAAVLLHDAKNVTRDTLRQGFDKLSLAAQGKLLHVQRSDHHLSSSDFAREILTAEGWAENRITAVEHCIRAHRFRDRSEPPQTLEAKILFDADKLDAIGAIGVARAIGYAAAHGQPAFAQPSEQFLTTGELSPGEPHSAYHEYLFKLRKLKDRLYTPTAKAMAEERHHFMEAFFAQLKTDNQGE